MTEATVEIEKNMISSVILQGRVLQIACVSDCFQAMPKWFGRGAESS